MEALEEPGRWYPDAHTAPASEFTAKEIVDVGYCGQLSDGLNSPSETRIDDAIWENTGAPTYLTIEESRALFEKRIS